MLATPKIYAKNLLRLVSDLDGKETKERVKKFKRFLQKQGKIKIASLILRELKKEFEKKEGELAEVFSAKDLSVSEKEKIKKVLRKKGFQPQFKKDSRLIGGIALFLKNEFLIEGTLRKRLSKIIGHLK